MKYAFGTDINGTNQTGIVDVKTMKVLCLCPKENADLILQALEAKKSHIENAAPEMYEAIQYYFSVIGEVRGADWDKKPDHVLSKMINAISKARGEQNTQP